MASFWGRFQFWYFSGQKNWRQKLKPLSVCSIMPSIDRHPISAVPDDYLNYPVILRETLHGFRNGLIYGVKIRLPHAIIMTLLFKEGPWQSKLSTILRLTYEHGFGLAKYVGVYKFVSALLARYFSSKLMVAFVSGCTGGYLAFQRESLVNSQIILYLTARALVSAIKVCWFSKIQPTIPKPISDFISRNAFSWHAMLAWGIGMCLWEMQKQDPTHAIVSYSVLISSQYLYEDSKVWRGWQSFFGVH